MTERIKRAIVPGLLLAAVYYAAFGGEYTVLELHGTRRALETEGALLETLRSRIDSLDAVADSLEHDPGTIERIAREEFGMIREGETLYRFVDGDSDVVPVEAVLPTR